MLTVTVFARKPAELESPVVRLDKLRTPDHVLRARPVFGTLKMYSVFILGGGARLFYIMLITFVLINMMELPYTISYAVAMISAAIFSFIYNRQVTFNRLSQWQIRFLRFAAVLVFIGVSNWTLVYVSTEAVASYFDTEILPEYYWPSILAVTTFLSVVNFTLNKKWVFKKT